MPLFVLITQFVHLRRGFFILGLHHLPYFLGDKLKTVNKTKGFEQR